ncbi:hypothetical protein F4778DRAFT_727389 [Xylariomycetidae sp. FL2044]|nr:hypothetical protein F4778DRAFT_727389 [Xylariomycetidae sp. FL2044]
MAPQSTPNPPYDVLIIGSGFGGLAAALALKQAGHRVTVFERNAVLRETGAGIQLFPNATRLLRNWGVLEELRKYATQPTTGAIRSYRGSLIARPPSSTSIEQEYDAPHLIVRRAALIKVLAEAVNRHGVSVNLGCEVVGVDFAGPSLRLASGEVHAADLILGADGERSFCRSALLGYPEPPKSTGDLLFRIEVPRSRIGDDHPSRELMGKGAANIWMGPGAHCVSYLLGDGTLCVVLTHPDGPFGHDYSLHDPRSADVNKLREVLRDWDPLLREVASLQSLDCQQWALYHTSDLASWHHESGRFLLIGDAAHAMLPFMAQGAAQAFEDAAALGAILGQLTDKTQIPDAVDVFETLRRPRAARVKQAALAQKVVYGLPDGPAQIARDDKMAGAPFGSESSPLRWVWEYDAAAEGRRAWQRFVAARTRASGT